jgi:hypothetical protein
VALNVDQNDLPAKPLARLSLCIPAAQFKAELAEASSSLNQER